MSTLVAMSGDFYSVLGLTPRATAAQVRDAYQWLMTVEESATRRAAVAKAYAVLGDPRLRAEYDAGQPVRIGLESVRAPQSTPGRLLGVRRRGLRLRRVRSDDTLLSRAEGRFNRRFDRMCEPSGASRFVALILLIVLVVTFGSSAYHWVFSDDVYAEGLEPGFDPEVAARLREGRQRDALRQPVPPTSADRIGYTAGMCIRGADGRAHPSDAVPCDQAHRFEVLAVVNLDRLVGRPLTPADAGLGARTCVAEFSSLTGLPGPAPDLWPSEATFPDGPDGSVSVCFAMSRYDRTGTVAAIAR